MGNFTQLHPTAYPCGNESMVGLIATSRKCLLQKGHTGLHTDGEHQWNDAEPETLDSNYDIAAKEASQPPQLSADEQAMYDRFMEKCKPFLPGVLVWTDFGIGRINRVTNVSDQYCPFEVACSDGQTRMFKRENLTLSAHQEPLTPAPAVGMSLQCEKGNGARRCVLTVGHTGEHDFGSAEAAIDPKRIRFVQIVFAHNTFAAIDDTGQLWLAPYAPPKALGWTKAAMPVLE